MGVRGGLGGILFDKDGTLFDFHATWGGWCAGFIADLSRGDAARAARLAEALDYDLAARRFRKTSPVIAGTMEVAIAAVRRARPDLSEDWLRAYVLESTAAAPQVPAVPLAPVLDRLAAAGLVLGIATNDAEAAARTHLARAGVLDRFAFIAGYDSGHGAKPGPGMVEAFCRSVRLAPERVAILGDSLHDLACGRAAGALALAVLTGPAERDDLAPHADAVIEDIGALPGWLGL